MKGVGWRLTGSSQGAENPAQLCGEQCIQEAASLYWLHSWYKDFWAESARAWSLQWMSRDFKALQCSSMSSWRCNGKNRCPKLPVNRPVGHFHHSLTFLALRRAYFKPGTLHSLKLPAAETPSTERGRVRCQVLSLSHPYCFDAQRMIHIVAEFQSPLMGLQFQKQTTPITG